jgi:LuxR family maltose regulon positive regulatory protein
VPSQDILSSKLHIPSVRRELVRRPRLMERLNEGLSGNLTLVSAPAGFGKTTLVSEWVDELRSNGLHDLGAESRVGWLSLDEGDAEPYRFLTYLAAALGQAGGIDPAAEKQALDMLHSSKPPPAESILILLVNNLDTVSERFILVLDDYHFVESSPVDHVLAFLLDHFSPHLHLVIATRVDPLLSLPRLRAQNQLTEIRAADLRFTAAEAAAFLNQVMGLDLSEESIMALGSRTEGWIAGLQLAALSLKGQPDTSDLIHAFTGSHRFVLDYLIEEVLDRQAPDMQTFLFKTAVLDRMNGPLCDAVTGQGGGQSTLEALDRANMFVVPLDEERHWYRYHRLFGDLLRQRLQQSQPEQLPILHMSASEWYERNGLTERAIRHSVNAEDLARAADLAESSWRELHMSYKGTSWLRWVEAIPDSVIRARPFLSLGCAWALIDNGDLEDADLRLKDVERWLASKGHGEERPDAHGIHKTAPTGDDLRSLMGSTANARAYLAQALGDVSSAVEHAKRACDILPENDHFERGLSAILTGFALWSSGDLDAAHQTISDAITHMRKLGKLPFVISFSSYLCDIMIAQGRLNQAKKLYLRLLDMATVQGEPEIPETSVVHFGLSEIHHEQGDLSAAEWHLKRGEGLGELPAFPPWFRHWVQARIRVDQSVGNLEGNSRVLDEAERRFYRHPIPDVHPLSALRARGYLVEGRSNEAVAWVREQGLAADDELTYLREFEYLTLARTLIAQSRADTGDVFIRDAIGLLGRLLEAAEKGKRWGSVIEILVLQALAHDAHGNRDQALVALKRAIALAEPEGYVHVFVGEGASVATLLAHLKPEELRLSAYLRTLLDGFSDPVSHPASDQLLVEPLSEREMEVLAHLASGRTNRDIAETLFLSVNTVKAHTRNIYGKLDVNNRTQAVAQARHLGLLET